VRAARRAAAALVAAGCVAAVALLARDSLPTAGPLIADDGASLGIGRTAGETFAYGLPYVGNDGDEPARLQRISPVEPTPGLRVVGTRVAGARRRDLAWAATPAWPDRNLSDVHPVDGFEIGPLKARGWRRGAELIFILRAPEAPGRYRFKSIQVDYRVGRRRHRDRFHFGLQICVTPRGEPRNMSCPAPGTH
jgi:hypothetical protein